MVWGRGGKDGGGAARRGIGRRGGERDSKWARKARICWSSEGSVSGRNMGRVELGAGGLVAGEESMEENLRWRRERGGAGRGVCLNFGWEWASRRLEIECFRGRGTRTRQLPATGSSRGRHLLVAVTSSSYTSSVSSSVSSAIGLATFLRPSFRYSSSSASICFVLPIPLLFRY